jgi:hypothetical protein
VLEIKTGIVIGFEVNGKEYPIENGGFESLSIIANKRMSVTTLEMRISDISGSFEHDMTLADGTPITIKIGRTTNSFRTYQFRVFKFVKEPGNVPNYMIYGYWNSPRWWMQTVSKGMNGTSAQVIQQIAEACSLKSSVDNTDDKQVWMPNNSRYCSFADQIANNGYLDDQSMMVLGMTLQGELRYRNISGIRIDDKIPKFVHASSDAENTFTVYDHRNTGSSGFGNIMGGYKHLMREQSVIEEVGSVKDLQLKRQTQNLLLNKDIHGALDQGRIQHMPINCGNVHKKYFQAQYQNMRSAMMYSMGVELMVCEPTDNMDLFDPFYYQSADAPALGKDQDNSRFKASYILTAKTIHVTADTYFEKFAGATTGMNAEGSGQQTTQV